MHDAVCTKKDLRVRVTRILPIFIPSDSSARKSLMKTFMLVYVYIVACNTVQKYPC